MGSITYSIRCCRGSSRTNIKRTRRTFFETGEYFSLENVFYFCFRTILIVFDLIQYISHVLFSNIYMLSNIFISDKQYSYACFIFQQFFMFYLIFYIYILCVYFIYIFHFHLIFLIFIFLQPSLTDLAIVLILTSNIGALKIQARNLFKIWLKQGTFPFIHLELVLSLRRSNEVFLELIF